MMLMIEGGKYAQSSDMEKCTSTAGDVNWSNYTLELKATKTAGNEGMLISFGQKDSNNHYWWNIGGWNNSRTMVEKNVNGAKREISNVNTDIRIETGKEYAIKIELAGSLIKCYLDGDLIHEVETAVTDGPLYAVTSRDADSDDIIVKVVNTSHVDQTTNITVNDSEIGPKALVTTLASDKSGSENSILSPMNIAPTTEIQSGFGTEFKYEFKPYSVTIFRLKTDGKDIAEIKSAKLQSDKTTLKPGRAAFLTLENGTLSDGSIDDLADAMITYESSDTSLATIDSKGKLIIANNIAKGSKVKVWGNVNLYGTNMKTNEIEITITDGEEPETPEEPVVPEPTIEKIKEIQVSTTVGIAAQLPKEVEVIYSDGTSKMLAVTWDIITKDQQSKVGSFVLSGKVEGVTLKAKATVTVTKKPTSDEDTDDDSNNGGSSSSGGSTANPKPDKSEPAKPEEPTKVAEDEAEEKETTKPVKVTMSLLNGKASNGAGNIELFVKPYIEKGRTMAGVRDIATLLGIEAKNIIWDAKDKTVLIKTQDLEIKFTINEKYILVNGEKVAIDVAPQIKDGRTVLPIAHLARILGMKVEFIAETKEVILIANHIKK